MAVNPFLNPLRQENNQTQERKLFDDLAIEMIKNSGIDVYYIKRDIQNFDQLFGQDNLSIYNGAIPIEMYLENAPDHAQGDDMWSKFGLQMNNQITFKVAITRFREETSLTRPREGDLIYIPEFDGEGRPTDFYEIKDVSPSNDSYWPLGFNPIWTIVANHFIFSNERFTNSTPEIQYNIDNSRSGNELSNDTLQDNDVLEAFKNEILDFDEKNPFGREP